MNPRLPDFDEIQSRSALTKEEVREFLMLYEKILAEPKRLGPWESLQSPDSETLLPYDALPEAPPESEKDLLSRLIVCKLNGGLGTSMGCTGPKSLIPVKEGKTFLDIILEQLERIRELHDVSLPLVLMNSFYTHEATLEALQDRSSNVHSFIQSRFPRLSQPEAIALSEKEMGREAWYPPGHGDFYRCIQNQKLLDRWLEEGREVIFISNADNLGAGVDLKIAHYMLKHDVPFMMEMTEKTLADVKGGTLYVQDGRLKLLELAQVPEEHVESFCSLDKFNTFNTNNIWINLLHLKRKLQEGPLNLEVIVNPKTVQETLVIQLETALGSALSQFPGARGLLVDRTRFRPVKKMEDLLLIQSNVFLLKDGYLTLNPARKSPNLPVLKLLPPFNSFTEFTDRIPECPDMLELDSLNLEGDIRFEGAIKLKGNVELIHHNDSKKVINSACLENYKLSAESPA